jgi:hypothetical protein
MKFKEIQKSVKFFEKKAILVRYTRNLNII